jgi:hypothetical protein
MVGQVGVTCSRTIQPGPKVTRDLILMVGGTGIEPVTPAV